MTCKCAIMRSDVASGNYYYFSWRRAIISKLTAARIINRNNQLMFGEIRRDVVPTNNFGARTPYKKGSVRRIVVKNFTEYSTFFDELGAPSADRVRTSSLCFTIATMRNVEFPSTRLTARLNHQGIGGYLRVGQATHILQI
jgi:hypothetical protein